MHRGAFAIGLGTTPPVPEVFEFCIGGCYRQGFVLFPREEPDAGWEVIVHRRIIGTTQLTAIFRKVDEPVLIPFGMQYSQYSHGKINIITPKIAGF